MKKWQLFMAAVAFVLSIAIPILAQETPTLGRIVQKYGTSGDITWSSSGVTGLTIQPDSNLPMGMTAEVGDVNVIIHCQPQGIGAYEALFVLRGYSVPDVNNWTGPPMMRQMTGRIEWFVFPEADSPFMSGLGDVLLPNP